MWLLMLALAGAESVASAFPPPEGAARVQSDPWGRWLQALQLRDASEPVRTYDGRVVGHHARVIDLPLVPGDLQQCADSLIRLRATWARESSLDVSFHATSGDPLPWSRVSGGEVPYASGRGISWRAGEASWERYLSLVFMWAGTASLEARDTRATNKVTPGSMLIEGGFPGHAVQVLDVARRGEQTFVLVAEGYMPAQDFHVELGPYAGWWLWEDGLALPTWTFASKHLRTWL